MVYACGAVIASIFLGCVDTVVDAESVNCLEPVHLAHLLQGMLQPLALRLGPTRIDGHFFAFGADTFKKASLLHDVGNHVVDYVKCGKSNLVAAALDAAGSSAMLVSCGWTPWEGLRRPAGAVLFMRVVNVCVCVWHVLFLESQWCCTLQQSTCTC